MTIQRNTGLIYFLAILLTGCTSVPYPVTSPYYKIPAGSRIILHKQLTIPADTGRVYLQFGKVISLREFDKYSAHCWFLSWKVLEKEQPIVPDSFIITASQKYENYVHGYSSLQFAAKNAVSGFGFGDGPKAVETITTLHIHSDKQPDIRRFICNRWEDPTDANHLTVAEMQSVLGNIATIMIKPE